MMFMERKKIDEKESIEKKIESIRDLTCSQEIPSWYGWLFHPEVVALRLGEAFLCEEPGSPG